MESNEHSVSGSAVAQRQGASSIQGSVYAPGPVAAVSKRASSPARRLLAGLATLALCAVTAATLWFVGAGSVFGNLASVKVGDLRTESKSLPQGSARSLVVNVNMGQGTLTLAGGATDLLDADFSYNVDAWKPQVTYRETGREGALSVEQSRFEGFVLTPGGVRNDWSLRFKDGIPLTLTGNLGSGTGIIRTNGLSVSKLDMSTGAGDLVLDLTGNWKQSLSATLQAGSGNTTILLPRGVGVRVKVESGVSQVDSGGLTRAGNAYTNADYGKTPVTLEITIKAGVGNVKIQPWR